MAMLEQSKRIEIEPVKNLVTTSKLEQATELSKELDKIVVKPIEELDIEDLLAEPTEFVRKGEYSKNLLHDLLNNDDLLDDLQDDYPSQICRSRWQLLVLGGRCKGRGGLMCSLSPN